MHESDTRPKSSIQTITVQFKTLKYKILSGQEIAKISSAWIVGKPFSMENP